MVTIERFEVPTCEVLLILIAFVAVKIMQFHLAFARFPANDPKSKPRAKAAPRPMPHIPVLMQTN